MLSKVRTRSSMVDNTEQAQLIQIAGDSPPIMNHPGIVFINNLYYSKFNSTVDAIRQEKTSGKDVIAVPGAGFGASASATLNADKMYGLCLLELELPAFTGNNIYLPRGWGLAAINSIDFTAGSSNQGRVQLDMHGCFMATMLAAKSSEARSYIIKMAGSEIVGGQTVGTRNFAYVPLVLPWSTWDHAKRPIDAALSASQFVLNIAFSAKERFMSGSGVPAYVPTAFSRAAIYPVTTLVSKAIAWPETMAVPNAIISYPSMHKISHEMAFTGNDTTPINIQLNGIIEGNLTTLAFMAVRSDELVNNGTGTTKLAPFNAIEFIDFNLMKDGTRLFGIDGNGSKVFCAHDEDGSGDYLHSMRLDAVATAPYFTFPKTGHVLYWSSVQGRASTFEDKFQNAPRYAGQTFNLSFLTAVGTTGVAYTLYWMAFYNNVITFQNGVVHSYT